MEKRSVANGYCLILRCIIHLSVAMINTPEIQHERLRGLLWLTASDTLVHHQMATLLWASADFIHHGVIT